MKKVKKPTRKNKEEQVVESAPVSSGPTVDLFYVTYPKDKKWFWYSVQIAKKNLKGIRNIVAVVREQHLQEFRDLGLDVIYKTVPDSWNSTRGYHWQQWIKMRGHEFSDADYIAHVDSDTYFLKPTDIKDFFSDGKPIWLYAPYSVLGNIPWKPILEKALQRPCDFEYMRSSPFFIKKELYLKAKEILELTHNCTLEKYIFDNGVTDWPPGFSEYNYMGNIAKEHFPNDYCFVEVPGRAEHRTEFFKGFSNIHLCWSHGDFSKSEEVLMSFLFSDESQKPIPYKNGIWILSNDTHLSAWVAEFGRLDFDGHLLPHVAARINPDDVVIDGGAFIGDHTYCYGQRALNGTVYAFEPNKAAYVCLAKNVSSMPNVKPFNCGLGSSESWASMNLNSNAGASHLSGGKGVKIITIDSLNLSKLNLIKLDIEGYELEALKGAEATIARCRPWLVLEFNTGALEQAGTSEEELLKWLFDRGYQITGEVGSPGLRDLFFHPKH